MLVKIFDPKYQLEMVIRFGNSDNFIDVDDKI